MSKDFYQAIKTRRSRYQINGDVDLSDEKIEAIVEQGVKHTPSAFNSQTARVVNLLDDEHDKFWEITLDALREVVPDDNFGATKEKIESFKNGYGTILYFEDHEKVEELQDQFPLYADNFPVWSEQSSGMLQYVIWTALSIEGLGASLQHYTELIEDQVKDEWDLPEEWKLIAQMPFGNPIGEPDDKEFMPLDQRIATVK
jgi:predicted oxidoreductase (fatty acid repression mutant protein)